MHRILSMCALVALSAAATPSRTSMHTQETRESWRAWLVVETERNSVDDPLEPAELPFGLELQRDGEGWKAFLLNGPERIDVPEVEYDGARIRLEMPHYDSRIRAALDPASGLWVGEWEKVRGKDRVARVPFRARAGSHARFPLRAEDGPPWNVTGRWRVDFDSDDLSAVGLFEQADDDPLVTGTFLTATGDYRYLAGSMAQNRLRLSCFDGAHAFLFDATLGSDGVLAGVFHSGDWWKENWTAVRDPDARLPDAYRQTTWNDRVSLAGLAFPDVEGRLQSLAHPRYAGRATLLQLFGSWCPNCHDETRYLVELDERYRARGLSILGLAFELTGEFERDAEQLEAFRQRHGVTYPMFVVGTADKAQASLAFPAIDRLRSYPTTIFLDASGRVRSVHTGFTGPATGAAHAELRREFEGLIEGLLEEAPRNEQALISALLATRWRGSSSAISELNFQMGPGGLEAVKTVGGESTLEEVTLVGDAVWIGPLPSEDAAAFPWRFDESAGVLLDPMEAGARLHPVGGPATPLLLRHGSLDRGAIESALTSGDALVRREAVIAWTLLDGAQDASFSPISARLSDEDAGVRAAAIWSAGVARVQAVRLELERFRDDPNASLQREARLALDRIERADR